MERIAMQSPPDLHSTRARISEEGYVEKASLLSGERPPTYLVLLYIDIACFLPAPLLASPMSLKPFVTVLPISDAFRIVR